MKIILTLAILGLVLSACASVESKIAKGVNAYCSNVKQAEREAFRARINGMIAPNQIKITCAGDT